MGGHVGGLPQQTGLCDINGRQESIPHTPSLNHGNSSNPNDMTCSALDMLVSVSFGRYLLPSKVQRRRLHTPEKPVTEWLLDP